MTTHSNLFHLFNASPFRFHFHFPFPISPLSLSYYLAGPWEDSTQAQSNPAHSNVHFNNSLSLSLVGNLHREWIDTPLSKAMRINNRIVDTSCVSRCDSEMHLFCLFHFSQHPLLHQSSYIINYAPFPLLSFFFPPSKFFFVQYT